MRIDDTRQIEQATIELLRQIDNGVLEAAYKIRDKVRDKFSNNGRYNVKNLEDGILLGKYDRSSHKIHIHAFGYNDPQKQTYKARFFEGGTFGRQDRKGRSRGDIEAINALSVAEQEKETLKDCIDKHIQDYKNKK